MNFQLFRSLFLSIILACMVALANAQVLQTAYIEIPVDKKQGANYEVKVLENDGVLCLLSSDEPMRGGQRKIIMGLYDTALVKLWEKDLLIESEEEVIFTSHERGMFYMLTKKNDDEYRVLKLTLDTGRLETKEMTKINRFNVSHFETHNGHLLIGGKVDNNPAVMRYSFYDAEAGIVLPSVTQLRANLLDIVVDTARACFYLLLERKRPATDPGIYVNKYDWSGKMLSNHDVRLSRDYSLLTYRPVIRPNGQLMLYGSYALGGEIYSQGVYNMAIEDGQITSNRFYDFGYLKNFFNYMPEKAKARRVKKVQAMLEEEKRMKLHYKLFMHELILGNDRVIMMAESYDTEADYRRRWNTMDNAMYGSQMFDFSMRRYMMALGSYNYLPSSFTRDRWNDRGNFPTQFKYKHAVVLAFSGEGKLLWDNAYVFKETESEFPVESAQAYIKDDSAVVVQFKEKELLFNVFNKSESNLENKTYELPVAQEGDITDDFQHGGLLPWHGQHFLASGIKKLRNRKEGMNTREIFFMARVSYDPTKKPEPVVEEKKD